MLFVAKKVSDKSFFWHWNTIGRAADAVSNDVIYHNTCWLQAKRESEPKSIPKKKFTRTLSDIEIINFIETHLMKKPDTIY